MNFYHHTLLLIWANCWPCNETYWAPCKQQAGTAMPIEKTNSPIYISNVRMFRHGHVTYMTVVYILSHWPTSTLMSYSIWASNKLHRLFYQSEATKDKILNLRWNNKSENCFWKVNGIAKLGILQKSSKILEVILGLHGGILKILLKCDKCTMKTANQHDHKTV